MNHFIKYRSDIDGLRAVAIISIFIYHLEPELLRGGFLGVDIFFVISGYLITRILYQEFQSKNFSYANFYARRIKRIFPALFVMFIITSIAAILILPSIYCKRSFFAPLTYASVPISNFYFAKNFGYFNDSAILQPLLHTWSLGVEEQFYLLWALVIALCFRINFSSPKKVLLVFAVTASASLLLNIHIENIDSKRSFYMFYCRIWEFCFGAAISLNFIKTNSKKIYNELFGIAGFSLILYSLFTASNVSYHTILACFGTALVIYSGQQKTGLIYRVLSLKPLVFIGLISYSLYLWHWPVISFYKYLTGDFTFYGYCLVIFLSLLFAILSYYIIEQNSRYSSRFASKDVIAIAIIAIAIFCVSGLAFSKAYDANWRITKIGQKKQIEQEEADKQFFDIENAPVENSYQAVLIGDSHAHHYFPAIYKYMKNHHVNTRLISTNGCPPFIGTYEHMGLYDTAFEDRCTPTRDAIIKVISDKNIKHVLIALREESYITTDQQKQAFRNKLEELVKTLRSNNKKIYILGQVPSFRFSPVICDEITIINRIFPALQKNCGMVDKEYFLKRIAYADSLYKEMQSTYGIEYFDPTPIITSAKSENGTRIYLDSDHLNISGARYIYPYLKFKSLEQN